MTGNPILQNKASMPKDALVMTSILKDMGIKEYEPRVISQMLEFIYKYVTNILDDARVYANHAKKKQIDVDDVKLAIHMQMDRNLTTPPPRDLLLEIARVRNSNPLPLIKPHCGLRLPPDRYCLTACNFRMIGLKKPQMGISNRITYQMTNNRMGINSPTVNVLKPGISSLSSKQPGTMGMISKSGNTVVATKSLPKTKVLGLPKQGTPVIKVNTGSTVPTPKIQISSGNNAILQSSSNIHFEVNPSNIKMEPGMTIDVNSLKRKRDEDDYDIL